KHHEDRSPRGVRHQAPTLIGCLVVKELQRPALPSLRCVADVSSFAAAEKRDYAEHSAFRQQFAEDFFSAGQRCKAPHH
ncbi:hypothetical protein, partial [Cupriavidus sp. BIS7]|uniref:hypothetical protein n=1 Tax=Cupriavidus sp. BIS7 TaxID=1217718 RepID=UPI001ED8C172